jgi:error-prone DNA polymerase
MTELLARTNFSFLHGASHPEEMVEAAIQLGVRHLGVVDRDGTYGLPRAFKAAKEAALHLLYGVVLTLRGVPSVALLVEDKNGWANLCRLLTLARHNDDKGFAAVDPMALLERASGLQCVLRHGFSEAEAAPFREAFGDRLSVLLSRRGSPSDRHRIRQAHDLSRALEVPLVVSHEPLFHDVGRARIADVLTCVRRGCTLDDAGQSLLTSPYRALLSEGELHRWYGDFPSAIRRADMIAERCGFSLGELRYEYPTEVVPAGFSPIGYLRHLTALGLQWRYRDGVPEVVAGQVEHELRVIETLDFPSYFLTVYDIVREARRRGILCQGRGSAANSAVCYALGITAVDPQRSAMLFERFISLERAEPPDIDVDFEHERREEVIQYIYERYGRERAALVNEVISYRGRSAIRDVGKAFGMSLDQVDRLARCADRWSAGAQAPIEALVTEAGLDPNAAGVRETLAISEELQGFPRHVSIHVGGFVIAAGPLIDLVPVEPAAMADRTVIQWDKDDIDIMGFVKVDVLGLGMLTATRKAFELVRRHAGVDLQLSTVPSEDPVVYQMFSRADTVGVFQIESRAQMSMLPRLRPQQFYDLVVEVAIVRPGPIQGGMVHPYLRRRNGQEPVTYAHPAIEPILERTLGVPLFQEQVMAMAMAVGGFSPGKADNLRRAMGAWRKRGKLDAIGRELVTGMVQRGIPEEFAEKIYLQILGFGEYGFPESHAASFALIVYVTGWLKCHYPAAFAAALINSQPMGFYSPRAILADAQRHGVEVRPLSIGQSCWDLDLEPSGSSWAIRLGFRLIEGLSEDAAVAVVAARQARPFASLADLAHRTALDRRSLRLLASSGALADLGVDRRQAAWDLQGLWTGLPLLSGLARTEAPAELPQEEDWDSLEEDYRAVGLSVRHHPVGLMREQLTRQGVLSLREAAARSPGERVRVYGLVSCRQRPSTAKGVVFMTLEDETGMLNLVVWPKVWALYRKVARHAVLLGVDGRLQRDGTVDGAACSVLVDAMWLKSETPNVAPSARNFH